MILKLNVVDRKQQRSHFFYDTIECVLIDEQGFPVLDIESHPYRTTKMNPGASFMAGSSVADRIAEAPEDVQQYNCQRKIHDLISGGALSAPMHSARIAHILDNFLVVPSPKHYMGWLGIKNAEFYYNFPYFVVVILELTGKLVISLEQERVEPVYKSSL